MISLVNPDENHTMAGLVKGLTFYTPTGTLPVELPSTYERLFEMGTGGRAAYPSLAEVRRYFEQIELGLLEAARTTDLARSVEGRSYHTAGEVLVFTGYHRGYHIGKMTTLRALLKKPRLFG